MIVGREEEALRELKELAPDLYNGVKERLLVETTIVSWAEYQGCIVHNGPVAKPDEKTQEAIDQVTKALKVIQKFYQDNPPA